jgi:2,5-diketo-D-gluconate reductase A
MTRLAPTHQLNDGTALPAIGYGTAFLDDDNAPDKVGHALDCDYRLVDTAARYGNEIGVGQGVRESSVPRADINVTTKLRGSEQGRVETRGALESSLERLGLDYVDLYLIHWPLPRVDKYVESWQTMIELRDEGLVRSVGVSNFTADHIDRLERETGVLPSVNQIEMHLEWTQQRQRAYNSARGIVTESWSPLRRGGKVLSGEVLTALANKYGVTPGQIALRWHIEQGAVPIPYSSNDGRIASNIDVFSFELADDDMETLASLDTEDRFGGDPLEHEEF